MDKSFTIRQATPPDTEAIASFQVAMAWETEEYKLDEATVRKGVAHMFASPQKGFYLVAETGGECIASLLVLYEWSDWRNGELLWIHSVYVAPAFRKLGVFRDMYTHVQALVLKNEAYKGIRLYVEKTNLPAQEVYKALGMTNEHYDLFEWLK